MRLPAAAPTAALVALTLSGQALAATTTNTITSSNWSGYAAHGAGTRFADASSRWRVPAATCVDGDQTFSSFWVGIGG